MANRGQAPASESSSTSFNWLSKRPERAVVHEPRRAGFARIIPFARRAGPHREAEGSGSLEVQDGLLRGVEVLLVEDDFIVAFDMQTMLEEEGAMVVGPAADLREAMVLFNQSHSTLRVAVLDVNLAGEHVFPLAQALKDLGIPFLFATAYADDERLFPDALRDAPRLSKPVLPNALLGQLKRLLGP